MKKQICLLVLFIVTTTINTSATDYYFTWEPNTEDVDHYELCYGTTPEEIIDKLNCENVGNDKQDGRIHGTLYNFPENTLYFFAAIACDNNRCSDLSKIATAGGLVYDVTSDYDGDGLKDPAEQTEDGYWTIDYTSIDGLNGVGTWDIILSGYGNSTEIPYPHDYDHDGITDIAVEDEYGMCSIYLASTNFDNSTGLLINDYSCSEYVTIGVFRPSNHTFYSKTPIYSGWTTTSFGISTDVPITGDWNGNGLFEIGVFRPSAKAFYLRRSDGTWEALNNCGINGDLPIAGDWNGDGKSQIGVFRPSEGMFHLRNLSGEWNSFQFGTSGDLPVSPH